MSGEITNGSYFQFFNKYHVIPAIGGFNIDQHFGGPVKVYASVETKEIDFTLALQLRVNVRTFNEKLGLVKDASNNVIISSPFDIPNGTFPDDIVFTFQDFIPDLNVDNIIGVGSFINIYSDFRRSIVNYFSVSTSANIFNPSEEEQYTGEFTKEKFVDLYSASDKPVDISGEMYIYFVSQLLTSLTSNNIFNNRSNKTINDGFIAGDVVLLSEGISIRLDLFLKPVEPLPGIDMSNNPISLLGKVYTAPLILHLDNL
jgi:hypothetical protein